MSSLLTRLFAKPREERRLRIARRAIRNAEHAMAKRRNAPYDAGYAELTDPIFLFVMLTAIGVLAVDLVVDPGFVAFHAWLDAAIASWRGA